MQKKGISDTLWTKVKSPRFPQKNLVKCHKRFLAVTLLGAWGRGGLLNGRKAQVLNVGKPYNIVHTDLQLRLLVPPPFNGSGSKHFPEAGKNVFRENQREERKTRGLACTDY
jgi:hypothetical protein